MYIKQLQIKNFRALEDIDCSLDPRVNIIVGPNASGKTTILEAMRLLRAMMAPRMQNETVQVLLSIGASSPHNPNNINGANLIRNKGQPLLIKARYVITDDDFNYISENRSKIVLTLVQSRQGLFGNIAAFNMFSNSSEGKRILEATDKEICSGIDRLKAQNLELVLGMEINFDTGMIRALDPTAGPLLAFLEQRLPPHLTTFSYFPADRAIPPGEPPIQIGAQDAAQQLESHNSQPQMKFARLKSTIFNAIIMSEESRASLKSDFARIFDAILRGRELDLPNINEFGQISIKVKDQSTGKNFEFDSLSSGEKGIVTTFFMIERTVVNGGIVLLDEPELHLNPAVCKQIIPFFVENYVNRKEIQSIICSHSPEIIAGSFEGDDCSVFHLVSERLLTPVRRHDREQVADALRRLGASLTEGLMHRGTIFVEGDDDVSLIEEAFSHLIQNYQIKDLGGRREVEKHIREIQEAERRGIDVGKRFFIFDRDGAPTLLQSTKNTRLLQWGRYCVENYLIDPEVIFDVLRDESVCREPPGSVGEVSRDLRALAMSQIDERVTRNVFATYGFENPGLRSQDTDGKTIEETADNILQRLSSVQQTLGQIDLAVWRREFVQKCEKEKQEMVALWDTKWIEDCDGKRLLEELHRSRKCKMSLRALKRRILLQMRAGRPSPENWRTMEGLIKGLIEQ